VVVAAEGAGYYCGVITRDGPVPPSQQIAAILRERIRSGALPPDSRIPSRIALAGEYGVAPETAAKAIRILRDEGLVVVVAGYGTFVSAG
jgi:DNA-binding GntR family transcriptional regulator